MKVGLPLVKILTQLAKNVLVPLELMAVASATDATIQKNKKKIWIRYASFGLSKANYTDNLK